MNEGKHTPGPWRFEKSVGGYGYGTWTFNGEYVISGSNEHGGMVLPILGRTHNWPDNAEANARLISAAPDLLAELKRLSRAYVSLLETGRDRILMHGGSCDPVDVMEAGDPALRSAREVIARATQNAADTTAHVAGTEVGRG